MPSRLRVVTMALFLLAEIAATGGRPAWTKEAASDTGVALQTILEVEQTARLLAILRCLWPTINRYVSQPFRD
jgi:hypothetical protein